MFQMENVNQPIAEVSVEHIHADECIFTFGNQYTLFGNSYVH